MALIVLMGLVVGVGLGAQAQSADDLAALHDQVSRLHSQGKYAEAIPIAERYIALARQKHGEEHTAYATAISWLAYIYRAQGRYAEAEPFLKRALAIREKALGPDNPDVGQSLNNLAELYRAQGRYAEAEPLYQRSLAIREKALGPDHPDVAASLNNLAALYQAQGRYADAVLLYQRSLDILEKTLGPDHPDVAQSLYNLAVLYFGQRDWRLAAHHSRLSTAVLVRRAQRGTADVGQALTGKRKTEAEQRSWQIRGLAKVAYRLALEVPGAAMSPQHEMFQTAQWAQRSEAAASLAQMAARGAKADPKLAVLVRDRQDLVEEWQKRERDAARSAAVAQTPDKRDRGAGAANVSQLASIDTRIADIDKRLAADFPDYAALARPVPLSVEDAAAQLGANEALVLFLDTPEWQATPEETFIWVVTKTYMRWVRSELGTAALSREVAALRCGLDYDGAWGVVGSKCAELLNLTYSAIDHAVGKPLPFDPARAHALYKALFGEVEDLIKDKHLLVVPSGALTQLPLHVLVTAKAETSTPNAADYRKIAWFARTNAITVLPAVSSLKALRQYAKPSQATRPFLGAGNPLLDGPDSSYADLKQAALKRKRCGDLAPVRVAENRGGGLKLFAQRGGIADVAGLRLAVPLPETADELCDVAKAVGAAEADILLGARASEREIKRLSEAGTLRSYRIVHFATHGALSGEISASAEPGLLLTPPQVGTEEDDGYLSASEIAGLKLDADWVILSACNTAAGEAKDAEALSGLARAFFYAGARALLVSHWYVDSNATVALIKGAFAELKANPKLGRAEALRRSMLALIDKGSAARAHPAAWAPFVVVGKGGAVR